MILQFLLKRQAMILTKTEHFFTFWHLILCLLILTLLHRKVRQKVRAFFLLLWILVGKCVRKIITHAHVSGRRPPVVATSKITKPLLPKKQQNEAKGSTSKARTNLRCDTITEQDGQRHSRFTPVNSNNNVGFIYCLNSTPTIVAGIGYLAGY